MTPLAAIALVVLAQGTLPREAPSLSQEPKFQPASYSAFAGAIVSMGALGSDTQTAAAPVVRLGAKVPLWTGVRPPWLHAAVQLGALPGQTLSAVDPVTFKTIEVELGLSHRPFANGAFSIYAGAGFTNRLEGDKAPRQVTARYGSIGLGIGRGDNTLLVGAGMDQRLDGTYQPAIHVAGSIKLPADLGAKLHMLLVGRAILGASLNGYGSARHDVVQVGVVISR